MRLNSGGEFLSENEGKAEAIFEKSVIPFSMSGLRDLNELKSVAVKTSKVGPIQAIWLLESTPTL